MRIIKRYWWVWVGFFLVFAFFYRYFLYGLIPFPGDLLTGAYYPWLEQKWGYVVGVPVKNPLISDVYSQLYLWKSLIVDNVSNGSWPLWNKYSYSGYPLLANFQSGVFNPLNVLMLVDKINGWSLMLFGQIFGSFLSVWWLLSKIGYKNSSKLTGAITYAFSGFPIVWLEYATVGQAMIWSPLVLGLIEGYAQSRQNKYLFTLPFVFFLIVASGHFQTLVYMAILATLYFAYRVDPLKKVNFEAWLRFLLSSCLAIGLSAIQLLPTIELSRLGIRFGENYAANFNFGLAPIKQLLSLLAPDFFGNPTTANYWGSFNYENTIYYAGGMAFLALVVAVGGYKKMKKEQFFIAGAIYALAFGFDTYFGRSIYQLGVPGLSTSVAGRVGMVFTLSMAVVVAGVVENIDKFDKKKIFRDLSLVMSLVLGTGVAVLLANKQYLMVGIKNSLLPITILLANLFVLVMPFKKNKGWLIAMILVFDLFRFGWKYTTFSPRHLTYPTMPVFEKIKEDEEVYRVDREKGEILPPNTWMAYGLSSPSGYDPMTGRDYVVNYEDKLNGREKSGLTRYSELDRYDAKALGEFNVKYLLVLKRDKVGKVPGDSINYTINLNDWEKYWETDSVAVLKNKYFLPRVQLLDNKYASKETEKLDYQESGTVVQIDSPQKIDGVLLIRNAWYPGWKLITDDKSAAVEKCMDDFWCVQIDEPTNKVRLEYSPDSFRLGAKISLLSLLVILSLLWYCGNQKPKHV